MTFVEDFLKRVNNRENDNCDDLLEVINSKNLDQKYANAEALMNDLHYIILEKFNEHSIFTELIDLKSERLSKPEWKIVSRHVEHLILHNKTEMAYDHLGSGLIQIYLKMFFGYYVGYPHYTYERIKRDIVLNSNPNGAIKNRRKASQELEDRLFSRKSISAVNPSSVRSIYIQRDIVKTILDKLKPNVFVFLLGPFGIGKTVILKNIRDLCDGPRRALFFDFYSSRNFLLPELFTREIVDGVQELLDNNNEIKELVLQFEDIHALPPHIREEFRTKTLPVLLRIGQEKNVCLCFLGTIDYELTDFPGYLQGISEIRTVKIPPFTRSEVKALLDKCNCSDHHDFEQLYASTSGYPLIINRILSLDSYKPHEWYMSIIENISPDKARQKYLAAICTFRYIGSIIFREIFNKNSVADELEDIWSVSKEWRSQDLWMKIKYQNCFISSVESDKASFVLNRPFVISPVLRQLAESYSKHENRDRFELRHRIAASYNLSQINREDLPYEKLPFVICEYIYHLRKSGLSDRQLNASFDKVKRKIETRFQNDLGEINGVMKTLLDSDEELRTLINKDLEKSMLSIGEE
ncbi:MAG: hypothetical protein H0S79_21265 [Anaerolineaceae bacterium]|nr:hypothetical protein [Anaerolineaceae bacterium]